MAKYVLDEELYRELRSVIAPEAGVPCFRRREVQDRARAAPSRSALENDADAWGIRGKFCNS